MDVNFYENPLNLAICFQVGPSLAAVQEPSRLPNLTLLSKFLSQESREGISKLESSIFH